MARRGTLGAAATLLCLVLAATGCATAVRTGQPVGRAVGTGTAATRAAGPAPLAAAAPSTPACDPTASLRPSGPLPAPRHLPAGSRMDQILKRGRLVVGTSQDTLLFSSRNPFTGSVEGFDVDLLRQVAAAIFGDPTKLQLVVVPNAERVAAVVSGRVDIVAETMTITCVRLQSVDFSTVYFQAGQKLLVAKGSTVTKVADLGDQPVCAAKGSTSLANLAALPSHPKTVAADTQAECLVLFQQGDAAAISTDDAILAGLAAQDPYAQVVGQAFSDEPYGMATSKAYPEFTRFVNAVLDAERADGRWTAMYSHWLSKLGSPPAPPAARYRD